jgi:hypothetical protein
LFAILRLYDDFVPQNEMLHGDVVVEYLIVEEFLESFGQFEQIVFVYVAFDLHAVDEVGDRVRDLRVCLGPRCAQ